MDMCLLNSVDGDTPGWSEACDSSSEYTHLLCDTDGDDRAAGVPRGHCALSLSATWQSLPSRSKEVSLLICINEGTLQGRATPTAHSSVNIYYAILCACMHLGIQTHLSSPVLIL